MADLPIATVTIDDEAGAFAGNTGYIAVLACVKTNADITPRVFASPKSLISEHGYGQGVSYAASHIDETLKPVIFVGLPQTTVGYVASDDPTGVTGSSAVTVAAASGGVLDEADAIMTVTTGGTIGTNGIVLSISHDGGRTSKVVRLGTANSYTDPYIGVVYSFGSGMLVAGDVFTFRAHPPMWAQADLQSARQALAAQLLPVRSFMVIGDLPNSTFAGYVTTEANAYETSNERFVYARASVKDRWLAKKSKISTQTITFAATGKTFTRSAGSWLKDGFAVGQTVIVAGTISNNGTFTVTTLTDTVMTVTETVVDEGPTSSSTISVTQSQTMAAYVSASDAAFATVDSQRRIDMSIGRGRKVDPISGWDFRRPAAWAASIREYQHDVQIPCWRKSDGPCDGWDLTDTNGNLAEFDERVDGGALAARFTCFRTWANGPRGAFIALSLTRATEASLLSRTHNMAVADVACTVTQLETENAIGQVLVLNSSGKATPASLSLIEERVNSALQIALLQDKGEGQRASIAVWQADKNAVLNVPGATLNGTLHLELNGTLEKIATKVKVQTAG
jgi:hypothetical protein